MPSVINNAGHTFLPFKLISPPYTTSYHFSSYLTYFPSIVGALRYSSSFPIQQKSVTQNMKMGAPNVINNAGRTFSPIFKFCVTDICWMNSPFKSSALVNLFQSEIYDLKNRTNQTRKYLNFIFFCRPTSKIWSLGPSSLKKVIFIR